jgi:hypothetical protein
MTDSCVLSTVKLNDTENSPVQTEQSDTKQNNQAILQATEQRQMMS